MDATLDPFTQTILAIMQASPAIRAKIGQAQPDIAAIAPGGPVGAQPDAESADPGELPGGTFTPQRMPDPPQRPVHEFEQGPLGRMLGLSPETSQMMRRFGAGASAIRGNPYGDPFITAAQGFGGAQAEGQAQEDAAAQAKYQNEKDVYERTLKEQERQRQDLKDKQELHFKTLAEKRAEKTADLSNQKTAAEIRKLARSRDVTADQYMRARAQAQADAEAQNISRDQRADWIDKQTDALLDKATKGGGLSDGGGISGEETYSNPDGTTIAYRNGQWVDIDTGEPYAGGQ
jgi:hypothetical protein